MEAYLLDCEFYCEDCAPKGSECHSDGGGESDCPQNCSQCHQPLGNPLTPDGVQYVLDAVVDSLRAGRDDRNMIHKCYVGTYYDGSRHCEIVRDWASELAAYGLDNRDALLVEHYMSWTDH